MVFTNVIPVKISKKKKKNNKEVQSLYMPSRRNQTALIHEDDSVG